MAGVVLGAVGWLASRPVGALAASPGPAGTGDGGGAGWLWGALLGLLVVAGGVILLRVRQNVKQMQREHEQLMRRLIGRRNELEAALSSMVEGVLAVDMAGRVISLNEAAAKLLQVRADRATGRQVDAVVSEEPLRQFVRQTLEAEEPIRDDIVLRSSPREPRPPAKLGGGEAVVADRPERLYQAQGAVLRDREGERIGSLIVLHDVTRLRRLEVVRQDFVANASHEIKTPVTAIKAAAETLMEAADEAADEPAPGQAQFVRIIMRQSDRLQAIVEDLLSLARLEQETIDGGRVALEPGRVAEVIRAAVETCAVRATSRQTRVEWTCDERLETAMHAPLLEQAVINLLDNAVKYSPEGSAVRVTAERLGDEVVIAVHDTGVGIAAEHLPRIFERFYRTDKARSRAMGGTGLGLSIVKHIALAHGGRVSVQSQPGKGSTFRVHLPAN